MAVSVSFDSNFAGPCLAPPKSGFTGSPTPLTFRLSKLLCQIMALLRGLFWFILFIVLAFCFVVLFEYGPHDFTSGCQKEFARVKSFVVKQTEKVEKFKK
jgi:hypothetical protein